MALPNNARFIAAAVLSGMLAAPQALALTSGGQPAAPVQLADSEAGKKSKAGKESKEGGSQTAKTRQQSGGGEGGFGVERPAPEGPDPNAPEGNGGSNGGTGGKSDIPPGDE